MRVLPPNSLLHRGSRLALQVVGLAALACSGCAKFPTSGGPQNTHVIFTMTVAGHIRNGEDPLEPTPYVYMVAVNSSTDANPTTNGPIAVVGIPWSNGMVVGDVTHFIRYWPGQQVYPYTVYEFPSTTDLTNYVAEGAPISSSDPGLNGTTIQFEIDLSQVTPSGLLPADLKSLQVNFLTMNRPYTGTDTGTKQWDALGDGHDPNTVNLTITIPLGFSGTYNNSTAPFQDIEPQGDGPPDPNLDIVNWSVEVRKP
jgi:hypothetical protein